MMDSKHPPFLKPIAHLILDDSISESWSIADSVFIEKCGYLSQ